MSIDLHLADARDVLGRLEEGSVHACVLDPPYELNFMGRDWDNAGIAFDPEFWALCLRLLPPGGHLVACGHPRKHHRVWCAIEDAGFEIRDTIQWLRGKGYPKSQAHLKPLAEPVCLARRPLEGTLDANLAAHGTGVLNVDACRVGTTKAVPASPRRAPQRGTYGDLSNQPDDAPGMDPNVGRYPPNVFLTHLHDCRLAGHKEVATGTAVRRHVGKSSKERVSFGASGSRNHEMRDDVSFGRDGRETVEDWECAPGCPVAEVDRQSGDRTSYPGRPRGAAGGAGWGMTATGAEYSDSGGASRFFPTFQDEPGFQYVRRPSTAERDVGCDGFYWERVKDAWRRVDHEAWEGLPERSRAVGNIHPTVKPVELMRWLVRLVTPENGTVLDPFMGSGSTALACARDGFSFVGVEREPDYYAIARARIQWTGAQVVEHGDDLPDPPVARQPSLSF